MARSRSLTVEKVLFEGFAKGDSLSGKKKEKATVAGALPGDCASNVIVLGRRRSECRLRLLIELMPEVGIKAILRLLRFEVTGRD